MSEANAGRDRRQRHREAREQLELRVRLDQLGVVAHDRGHDGAPRHGVGLAHRQHREGLREQEQALEVVDHHEAHEGPAGRDADDHPPAAADACGRAPGR